MSNFSNLDWMDVINGKVWLATFHIGYSIIQVFGQLDFFMFLKEVSYAHQDYFVSLFKNNH